MNISKLNLIVLGVSFLLLVIATIAQEAAMDKYIKGALRHEKSAPRYLVLVNGLHILMETLTSVAAINLIVALPIWIIELLFK